MNKSLLHLIIPYRNSPGISFRIQKQLPFVAITAFFLLITFILLAFVAVIGADGKITFFVVAILFLFLILSAALVMLRKQKYLFASRTVSLVLFASSMAALYLMPYTGIPTEAYRPLAFITIMSVCNIIVSFELKQLLLYFAGALAGWLISFATLFKGLFSVNRPLTLAIFLVGILGLSVANLVLILLKRLSDDLLDTAEKQTEAAHSSLANLTMLMKEARDGMEIGDKILDASGQVQKSLKEVEGIQTYMTVTSESLIRESDSFTESSRAVLESAKAMKDNLDEQNTALTETSAAITEISANLANISGIATKRRAMLSEISQGSLIQKDLVKKLLEAVSSVQKSSEGINVFVALVQDVASRTGLLAMNASIEAARAGATGKGFAVIAQEIRGLSEETQKNAGTIKNLLGENDRTVASTGAMMKEFSTFIEKNVKDTQTLTESIDEILRGITEMDIGTREVMEAAQDIVSAAQDSGEMVATVVSKVDTQKEGFTHIAGFSSELHDRISLLEKAVRDIRAASDLVADAGRLNTAQVKKLQIQV